MLILNKISTSSKDKIATNSLFIISEDGIVITISIETLEALFTIKENFKEVWNSRGIAQHFFPRKSEDLPSEIF